MTRPRAPGAASEYSRRIIQHLLGTSGARQMLTVIAVLVSLGWFTDSLFEWLTDLDRHLAGLQVANWWPLHRIIGSGLFILMVLLLGITARQARHRYRPRVASDYQPAQARALILYLSALRPETMLSEQDIASLSGLDNFRQRFGDISWRMPIEAIAHHRPRLQRVIVISSSGEHGSRRQFARFQQLCQQLFATPADAIHDLGELDSTWGHGLDFNDVERLTAATDDAHRLLEQRRLSSSDILIDITGGQATNSIAGCAVALASGRTIQYVSCDRQRSHYQVIAYDITWDQ